MQKLASWLCCLTRSAPVPTAILHPNASLRALSLSDTFIPYNSGSKPNGSIHTSLTWIIYQSSKRLSVICHGILEYMADLGQDDLCKCLPWRCSYDLSLILSKILACSIVSAHPGQTLGLHAHKRQGAVLIFSLGVRWRNKRRIRKHSERKTADTAERGEMAQATPQEEQVPFGIRAIERGCEVDGVWNSRTNTPLQTPGNSNPGSPVMRPKDLGNGLLSLKKHRRDLSVSTESNLEIPAPTLARPEPKGLPESSTDTASEAKSSSEQENARECSPDRELSMRGRRAYQPKTSSRNVSYPPRAYPPPTSSRCISYPPSAYPPRAASRYKSYPSSVSCA